LIEALLLGLLGFSKFAAAGVRERDRFERRKIPPVA
jgi:hypothetical protein